ncbi:hypothetical protein EHQ31_00005 [Leptospira montravelensis]|uniref:Uncharacterized protein n=1 Tax=Leptospira montravelensis TaxID=2484961 RepID=A0ABY2LW96_9LEPT|nr:hypothetical protein [Leptospira montravelensis]TGK84324.1 hypothetical protein EHQ19_07465 [Leptospira montravelensis]TGL06797.1 hypothetical protein EHQ31_00005 [Leptospira montravelensis]
MATYDYQLNNPPDEKRARELWIQHAAGFIIFQDVRKYAIDRIDETLDEKTKSKILEGIDNAIYGLMMLWDGVSGNLSNDKYSIRLETIIKLEEKANGKLVDEVTVTNGDGMCIGFHGWREGDFGNDEIVNLS